MDVLPSAIRTKLLQGPNTTPFAYFGGNLTPNDPTFKSRRFLLKSNWQIVQPRDYHGNSLNTCADKSWGGNKIASGGFSFFSSLLADICWLASKDPRRALSKLPFHFTLRSRTHQENHQSKKNYILSTYLHKNPANRCEGESEKHPIPHLDVSRRKHEQETKYP